MNTVIIGRNCKNLGRYDLMLHNFYLAVTKKEDHNFGKGKNVIVFIGENIGNTTRVHYFYENEKFITQSDIKYLLDNFDIKENVTEKCKLICEL